ncbi:MAG TPA: tetratricopeptide repeat protein [Candidatus Sulfotelmatobacter sp.]|nr:tetratricopeptide repeat protein [Candidatus Sulfotelmatobacter sp.]
MQSRPRRKMTVPLRITFFLVLSGWVLMLHSALAQSNAAKPSLAKPAQSRPNAAEVELEKRLAAAQNARTTGDPSAIAAANDHLIALALRELAQLRLIQSAYPQAVELYRRSLDFEDVPDARVDLGIADLQADHPDDALTETNRALAVDPNNARAWNVSAQASMKKGDYDKAAGALDHAARLNPDIETLYSLGVCLLQAKDTSKEEKNKQRASALFQQMIELAGDSGSLHVLFGRAYRDANEMPAAIREFRRAIALDPATPHAHYFLGLAIFAVNEWHATPEIKSELSKEIEHFPHDYLANYMLGFIASSERRYEVSDKYLTAAVEANPDWPEPWLYMGLNAYAQSDMKRAEQMLRKAVETTGSDEARSNFQIRRAYIDLGRILATSGRTEESEMFLTKARALQNKVLQQSQQNVAAMALAGGVGSAAAIVPLNPKSETEAAPVRPGNNDPFARVDASVMARAHLTEKQRAAADSQETHLRSVLGLSFNDLATSEAVRKEYSVALGHYQEAERWDPAIPGLAKNLGLSAFRINNYPEAIRGFGGAINEKPEDAPVRAMLGLAYFGAEEYADAAKTFSPLGLQGMQDSTVGYAWAASLAHSGDLKKATEVLAEFEKQNQGNSEKLLLIGQLWIEIGDYARAVDTFHRALQADSSLPKAHYFAGQADIRWEHWPEAAGEFQAELKLEPTDPDALFNLGFVYLQESRRDDAATLFQQALNAQPDHANANYELGKILLDRGQLKEAVDHLETATRLSPQSDYMHYQLQVAYRKVQRVADADRELEIYKELKAKQRAKAGTQSMQTP